MKGYIDGVNFCELEPMKYYCPPASWDSTRKQNLIRTRIFDGGFLGAKKMDGFFTKFVKDEDGNIFMHSRSRNVKGEYVDKHEWVPQLERFFQNIPNGTCVLGELYLPNKPGSHNITSILGCLLPKALERQKNEENKLHFYIFDVLAYYNKSLLKEPAQKRFLETLPHIRDYFGAEYVEVANYLQYDELWEALISYLEEGGEGFVITAPNALYEPGKRPSKTTLKVKQELQNSIDCIVIGALPPTRIYTGKQLEIWQYWQNTLTGEKVKGDFYEEFKMDKPLVPITHSYFLNWAGSLKLGLYGENGKCIEIGSISGLPDEVLSNWRDYIGKVLTVSAMDVYKDSMRLRHPKSLGFRDDKAPKDCTIDQIK